MMWKEFKDIAARESKSRKRSKGCIFIVEENLSDRQFFCKTLTKGRFSPLVIDKTIVMEMAEFITPCLIIINSIILDENTLDLCAKLKLSELTKHIPVLIIAEKDDDSNVLEYYSHDVDYFLIKPISKNELISQVNDLIYMPQ